MTRLTVVALPLVALLAPLPAQAADGDAAVAVAALNDPVMQDRIADTVAAMVDTLMQINVGSIAAVVGQVDPESRAAAIPADATLGEVTGRDDPAYAERLGDDVHATTRMAGRMAASLAALAPVLKDMAHDMKAQWDLERRDPRR